MNGKFARNSKLLGWVIQQCCQIIAVSEINLEFAHPVVPFVLLISTVHRFEKSDGIQDARFTRPVLTCDHYHRAESREVSEFDAPKVSNAQIFYFHLSSLFRHKRPVQTRESPSHPKEESEILQKAILPEREKSQLELEEGRAAQRSRQKMAERSGRKAFKWSMGRGFLVLNGDRLTRRT